MYTVSAACGSCENVWLLASLELQACKVGINRSIPSSLFAVVQAGNSRYTKSITLLTSQQATLPHQLSSNTAPAAATASSMKLALTAATTEFTGWLAPAS